MSNVQTSEALNLLSLTPKNENITKDQEKGNGEEFLKSLIQAIDEKSASLPKDYKTPEKKDTKDIKDTKDLVLPNDTKALDDKDALKLFENANFIQILSLLEVLQSNSKDIKLNKLVKDNFALLSVEKNIHKLKSIKNINELLNIAKDLGLNIKNIKFEQIKDLKEAFPNLDKKGFFDIPKQNNTNVFQDLINQKISNYLKEEPVKKTTFNKTKENDSTSLLSSALKNIDLSKKTKELDKKDDIKKLDLKEHIDEKIQLNNEKEIKDKKIIDNPLETTKTKTTSKLNDVEIINLAQNSNKDLTQDKKKIDKKINTEELKITNNEESFSKKINSVLENSKELKTESANTKNQTSQVQQAQQIQQENKINLENLLSSQDKTLKTQRNEQNSTMFSDIFKNTQEHTKNDEQTPQENLNSFVKDMNRVSNNFIKNQNIPMKETFNDFAQEFKEKVESYKAPITRFSITLNPHNLGEVEVTLVQRGSNLNISFNSNQNTLNLFIQHQAEFKNALVNMGFTNLEMNFSDQGRKEQNQQQKHKQNNNHKEDKVNFEKEIQEKPSLEMVLAKYF
ncbi:flagellar hook-length control protein FliK [Campylobacter volucris]|uniref:flagellar hook-length control protein FliK n=1 Tax=Campylobacter volucris TaxID=1031542 RepID=UPI00105946D4|nr:flagellar hook-length control protein FliK [Campylobacter volucris]TDJ86132.1 flagellar hook-length control protein FliK [Campylobacter volucris]